MYILGLTGGIACGKSSVLKIFQERKIPCLSADAVVHDLLKNDQYVIKQISDAFGSGVVSKEGIDRRELGKKVFGDKDKLQELESFLHPAVKEYFEDWKKTNSDKELLVYEIPLLFEKKREKDFDGILCVSCSEATQISRMKSRDNLSEEEIRNRLDSQMPLEIKEEKSDFVIYNNSDLEHLKKSVEQVLKELPSPGIT